jgi:hypothetical protein
MWLQGGCVVLSKGEASDVKTVFDGGASKARQYDANRMRSSAHVDNVRWCVGGLDVCEVVWWGS